MKKKVLIVVGSTGGHYFPGITLGEKIKEIFPDIEVIFAGEKRLKNNPIWGIRCLHFHTLYVLKRPKNKIFLPLLFFQAVFVFIKNLSFLLKIKPDLVVCMGSYASVMIGISAFVIRKPVIVHEQNLFPGLANRILNKLGIPAAITFKETQKYLKNTVHTGLPLRKEMLSKGCKVLDFEFSPNRKTILVLGGSQGALFINTLVLDLLEKLNKEKYQFIHICGKLDYERVKKKYEEKGIPALIKDFSFELPDLMNISDIGISRAGAGTLAELSFKGIPSILIPYRYGGGHQFYNAKWAENFGCIMMVEKDASVEKLVRNLLLIESDLEKRKRLFQSAKIADVNGNLAKYCLKILK